MHTVVIDAANQPRHSHVGYREERCSDGGRDMLGFTIDFEGYDPDDIADEETDTEADNVDDAAASEAASIAAIPPQERLRAL
ncbi:MAG: hypothetical protein AAF580_06315 [Pseudomonadota bacterium]